MRDTPTNRDDLIDSRSVVERIEELEDERTPLSDALDEAREALESFSETGEDADAKRDALQAAIEEAESKLEEWDESSEGDELKALKEFADEAEGYCDWNHGATLIRDSYFEDYARQFAEDIGAIKRDMAWPCDCIDWEKAASELKADYTAVEFDGVTYWVQG